MKNLIIILFTSLFLISCDTYNTTDTNQQKSIEPMTYTIIAQGDLHGDGAEDISAQKTVITDDQNWQALITKMDAVNNESEKFSEITIDFSEYMLIAVFEEIKGNGGYSIDLNITADTENIIVHSTTNAPQGMAITVMTQPYIIVKLPKSDLPVIFE